MNWRLIFILWAQVICSNFLFFANIMSTCQYKFFLQKKKKKWYSPLNFDAALYYWLIKKKKKLPSYEWPMRFGHVHDFERTKRGDSNGEVWSRVEDAQESWGDPSSIWNKGFAREAWIFLRMRWVFGGLMVESYSGLVVNALIFQQVPCELKAH